MNGQKCAKIERNNVAVAIEYWANSILCGVVGSNPPLEVIEGFVHRIRQHLNIDRVVFVRKGILVVRFKNQLDQQEVLRRGLYFFDRKPFIVRAWNEVMQLDISSLHTLPIWVQLPNLKLKYWCMDSLSELAAY